MHRHSGALSAVLSLALVSTSVAAEPQATKHAGMCDASAGALLGQGLFAVANDEDNLLRVYRTDQAGDPVGTPLDLKSFLKPKPAKHEADIEGAAVAGERVYWITSHGTNKDGEERLSRRRLFATEVNSSGDSVEIVPVGKPYDDLVEDLGQAAALKDLVIKNVGDFDIQKLAEKAPEKGGLNIEGLAATPDGDLLLGFRSPLLKGKKALIVPLTNSKNVVDDGMKPELGEPIQLSLGGRGIRSIEYSAAKEEYLIVAGPPGDDGTFALFRWKGPGPAEPQEVTSVDFGTLSPEALLVDPEDATGVLVLSDDGSQDVDGEECKEADPEDRSFRSRRLTLPAE